jgi:isochorismate pyruvate lyase
MDRAKTDQIKLARDCQTMPDVRQEIDRIDRAIVALIAERSTYIAAAARIKKSRDTVHDDARIADVLAKVEATAELHHVPKLIVRAAYEAMIRASIDFEFTQFDKIKQNA